MFKVIGGAKGVTFNNRSKFTKDEDLMYISEEDMAHKKEMFERFLTYRRRMSRMASIQALFMLDIALGAGEIDKTQIALFTQMQYITT